MARFWFTLMLTGLFVLGSLPLAAALPEVEDKIYWFKIEDEAGDDPEECWRLTDNSQPSPCDLRSIEIGNTDTHLLYRIGVETTDFGTAGQFGHVDYTVRLPGDLGSDFAHQLTLRLDSSGALSVQDILPENWGDQIESGLADGLITIAIPFTALGEILDGEEAIAHTSWVNVSMVKSDWEWVTGVTGQKGGEAIDGVSSQSYVIQPFGELKTPKIDPILIEETVTGATLNAMESFSTGPPTLDDECKPWNETCFFTSQPITAHYVYKWALDLPSVELSFGQEIVNGSADLAVIDEFDTELVRISSDDAVDAAVQEVISPIQSNVLTFVVELDRFEGSFEVTAKEGPPLDGGDMDDDMDHSDHNMDGDGDGNTTSDDSATLDDESGGIPGPGVVVLLAVLAGIVSLRRRR